MAEQFRQRFVHERRFGFRPQRVTKLSFDHAERTLVDKYHQIYKPLPLFDWAEKENTD
jgi:hypothetical protein